jgi:hypothetical protein
MRFTFGPLRDGAAIEEASLEEVKETCARYEWWTSQVSSQRPRRPLPLVRRYDRR